MSSAAYGERGGTSTLRTNSTLQAVSSRNSSRTYSRKEPPASASFITPAESPQAASEYTKTLSHARIPTTSKNSNLGDNLDFPGPDDVAHDELLHDAVFPTWRDDSGGDGLESPEEMQKKDPLGTQIWKLYSRTKTRLPNQERMENLTWRMMAMNLKRREQMQAMALCVPCRACQSVDLLT